MKHLLIMRHGKSDWNLPGQEDIERPLAPRGHRATRGVAKWIKKHRLEPAIALISNARRTQETWRVAQDTIGAGTMAEILEALYLASPGEVLEQLAGIADDVETVMVIAHNPGLEALCHMLAGPDSDDDARDNLRRGLSTAALAVFELAGDNWSTLSTDGASLKDFVRPRELD